MRSSITSGHVGLRVVHITPSSGGAAIAAKRLHEGLRKIGIDSTLLNTYPQSQTAELANTHPWKVSNKLLRYADIASTLISHRLGLPGMIHVSSLFSDFVGFDVIHLHGADSHWFNLHALKRLNKHQALVWTMHDKQLGTGGCGYPETFGGCQRWLIGCGHCPKAKQMGWWSDFTHSIHQRKRRIVAASQMAVVAPSHWMLDFVKANPITRNQTLRLIPNGVDTRSFAPLSAVTCRKDLALPLDNRLLLSIASNWDQPRKGLHYYEPLLTRLKTFFGPDLALVLVGDLPPADHIDKLRNTLPVYTLGKMKNVELLRKAYNAADLFLITSVIDNLPNVVLESLACGTPVAGFRVGGIPDMVKPGRSGVLSELGNTTHLAVQICTLLKDPAKLEQMRLHSRERVVQHYSLELQATRYLALYKDVLANV